MQISPISFSAQKINFSSNNRLRMSDTEKIREQEDEIVVLTSIILNRLVNNPETAERLKSRLVEYFKASHNLVEVRNSDNRDRKTKLLEVECNKKDSFIKILETIMEEEKRKEILYNIDIIKFRFNQRNSDALKIDKEAFNDTQDLYIRIGNLKKEDYFRGS